MHRNGRNKIIQKTQITLFILLHKQILASCQQSSRQLIPRGVLKVLSFSERELGRAFKLWLEKQRFIISDKRRKPYTTCFQVYLNKPVQTNRSKFESFWKTKKLDLKDIPPSQPEIDMIIIDNHNVWRAIELKFIKKTKKGISPSYYFGIGQAFSYLAYGMDEVALWQCFDGESMTDKEISDYYRALGKIRALIPQFVDLTFLKIQNRKQKFQIQTAIFGPNEEKCTWSDGIGIHQKETGEYRFTCQSFNPFLHGIRTQIGISTFPKNIVNGVRIVREFLEAQKNELWDMHAKK